jgi:prophage regulatory protein
VIRIPPQHQIVLGPVLTELTGYRETQLKEMVATGVFPRPVKLGPRKLGWILAEVLTWQKDKIDRRDRALAQASATKPQTPPRWKPSQ